MLKPPLHSFFYTVTRTLIFFPPPNPASHLNRVTVNSHSHAMPPAAARFPASMVVECLYSARSARLFLLVTLVKIAGWSAGPSFMRHTRCSVRWVVLTIWHHRLTPWPFTLVERSSTFSKQPATARCQYRRVLTVP